MATSKKPMPLLVRAKETTPPSVRTGGRLFNELTALGNVLDDDLTFIVYRPTDQMSYRGTFSQFKAGIIQSLDYGLLYTLDGDASSPLMSQTATASMALLETWNMEGAASGLTVSSSTSRITAAKAGRYEVNASICFSGTNSKTYEIEIYHDDISASPMPTATGFKLRRVLGAGGDVGSASLTGILDLAIGDSVMLYMKSTNGGTAFTCHQAQMAVAEI